MSKSQTNVYKAQQSKINQYYKRFYNKKPKHSNASQTINTKSIDPHQTININSQTIVFDMSYQNFIVDKKIVHKRVDNHKEDANSLELKMITDDNIQVKCFDYKQKNTKKPQKANNQPKIPTQSKRRIHSKNLGNFSNNPSFNDKSQKVVPIYLQTFTIPTNLTKNTSFQAQKKMFGQSDHFDHFPQYHTSIKNQNSKKRIHSSVSRSNHKYSKTLDFKPVNQTDDPFDYRSSTIFTQNQSKLPCRLIKSHVSQQNSIQMKVKKTPQRKKQMIDIVKRRQSTPSPQLTFSKFLVQSSQNEANLTQQRMSLNSKEGLFKQFKPKLQLKKRPSTGIPLRKSKNMKRKQFFNNDNQSQNQKLIVQSHPQKYNPNERVHNFFKNLQYVDSKYLKLLKQDPQKYRNRTLSFNPQNIGTLCIKTRQIHKLKYTDLQEKYKLQNIFPQQIQNSNINLVHFEFHKRNYSSFIEKNKKFIKQKGKIINIKDKVIDEFKPWDSVTRQEQFNNPDLMIMKLNPEDENI